MCVWVLFPWAWIVRFSSLFKFLVLNYDCTTSGECAPSNAGIASVDIRAGGIESAYVNVYSHTLLRSTVVPLLRDHPRERPPPL